MRVVAFGTGDTARDTTRDADAERIWCAEVPQLRALLAEAGYEAQLETALAPGAVPLKTVPAVESGEQRREAPRAARLRSRDGH